MRKLISILTLTAALGASAADAPLWLRNAALSPDGSKLAFTYKGDIFTVPVAGGDARQITTSAAYDSYPVWSPDGSKIAFASDREGSLDIYVMPATGGTAKRLTTNSGKEIPRAFLDDNTVLFSTTREGDQKALVGPFQDQVYSVNINGGREHLYRGISMAAISVSPDGRIAYQDRKGYEDILRKHEHSSGTADIWVMDGNKYTKITSFNGQDQCPVWVDANTIAFISEQDGTMNVWRTTADGNTKTQLTHFTNHPVRSLTRANNGLLAFSWNGELYTMAPGQEPQKVNVNIVSDDYTGDLQKTLRTSGATDMAPSPDGKEVAFVLRGDVYVTNVKYKTTKRITNTPAQERRVSFAPDGKSLVYDSERDGLWQIFVAKIKNPDEKQFAYATEITEELLYKGDKPTQQPAFSPDGKKVAFLYNRTELRVIDIASKKVDTALDGKYNYSYSDGDITYTWSPDSRWFLIDYIGIGGWNNSDIALVKADGSEVVDLTESGYTNSNPRWAMGGRAVTYETSRYGMRSHGSWGEQSDVEIMALDGDAWDELNRTEEEASIAKDEEKAKDDEKSDDKAKDKKKGKKDGKKDGKADKKDDEVKPLEFDLANRKFRVRRLTAISGVGDYWVDNDGANIYYTAGSSEGGSNLMVRDLRKGETKVLVKGRVGGLEPDKKGENLFALGNGMCKIAIPDGKRDDIEFEAPYDRHPSQEREYIYNHMLRQVRDKFYDASLHGVDWDMYGENYARFLPHINNNYDFAELLSEILGELNASHTGGRYYAPGADLATANLGAFFDQNYTGDGLKVSEVVKRGPLADKKANVQAGDIITAIDGEQILADADYYPLLDGKAGKPVRLTIKRNGGKTEDITVRPIDTGKLNDLLYQRWVERNQAVVDSLSNGRVGYVHIEGMDSSSFREVYSQLLGKYRNCEAVVVDTRWNGGGWLHNDIALLLSGKEYVRYSPQGQYIGSDPFSQWTKPSAMLVCEGNYSDAHGTPYVYQTLKIGDIIGAPVPGTMTAVWWETQIDPSLIFGIPQVTSLDRNGKPLENQQLNPDVVIYNNPADVLNGKDDQLIGAVNHLLNALK
jgi:Tol biopolymer transport system component/C-terminal processing protease CtpA/Prc